MKRILILGSLNLDLVQRVPRIPVAGETLRGGDLQTFVGGKGANQACAAARLGGSVQMAGLVGTDTFSERILSELQEAGVQTELVGKAEGATGSATIFVLESGDNVIVISPGANGRVSVDFALEAIRHLEAGDLLLCQLEIPMEVVEAAITTARARQIITMLDPAPACPLPPSLFASISILTPNQTEAALLLGIAEGPKDMEAAEGYAAQLRDRGAEAVIIKMGDQGCLIASAGDAIRLPGFKVPVVDTTAAGDTFNGALAAGLAEGATLAEAAKLANAAAALSVTKPGALNSIPTRIEVDAFLASGAYVHS